MRLVIDLYSTSIKVKYMAIQVDYSKYDTSQDGQIQLYSSTPKLIFVTPPRCINLKAFGPGRLITLESLGSI